MLVLGVAAASPACGAGTSKCGAQTKCVSGSPPSTTTSTDVGQICITHSEVGADGLGTVEVVVTPKGCISSSVHVDASSCTLTPAPAGGLTLAASFTFTSSPAGQPTLPDCSGGRFTTCSLGGLAPGATTITAGQTTLDLTVPQDAANAEHCAGAPY